MAGEKREVSVKLSLEMGPQNERAFRDLERQLAGMGKQNERVMQAASAAFNPLIRNPIGGSGGPGGAAPPPEAFRHNGPLGRMLFGTPEFNATTGQYYGKLGGLFGGSGGAAQGGAGASSVGAGAGMLGGALGRVLLPMLAAGAIANTVQTAGRSMNDPHLTDTQRELAVFRSIPGADRIFSFMSDMSGRTARYERATQGSQERQAMFGIQNQQAGWEMSWNPRLEGAQRRSELMGAQMPITAGNIDRSTAMGERTFREESRMVPLRREAARAEREFAVATRERVAAEQELGKTTRELNFLQRQRSQLARDLEGHPEGSARQELLLHQRDVEQQIQDVAGREQTGMEAVYGARGREATAGGQRGLIRGRMLEEQAGILEDRAATSAAAATNLGTMGPMARARGLEAFRLLQQTQNPDMLPASMLQQALSIGGEDARKIVERFGAATPEFNELRKLAPGTYAGDPNQLRRQAGEARTNAEDERVKAEADIARGIEKSGEGFGLYIVGLFDKMFEAAKSRIDREWKIGKNAP